MNKYLMLVMVVIMAACNNPGQKTQLPNKQMQKAQPVQVIFDTDLGNDIDDVLALQMVLNYHKQGKINLLGITLSKANPLAVQYVDGYCNFNNMPNVPIGYVYNGVNPEEGTYLRQTLETIIDERRVLQPQRSLEDSIPEGYVLMRKILSSKEDNSVVIIAVGPETNLARLLNSEPDQYSELSGIELVEKKVKMLSVMGGLYGDEYDFPEWNILQDLPSSQTVFNKWPTKIIASGWEVGNALLYPHQSIEEDFIEPEKHPLCVSYNAWGEMPYDRPTWDLTSVLITAEPNVDYFELSHRGKITINDEGKSLFSESKNGKHYYLIHKASNTENVLNALINAVTWK